MADLTAQAARLRAELARLNRKLAGKRQSTIAVRAAHLVEANEHLVLTLLHERSAARSTENSLNDRLNASQFDELTKLPARSRMRELLQAAIDSAATQNSVLAVLFVDLDDFKSINDSLGHRVGDLALQVAARRMQEAVRHTDAVSRHGGEEFLVLLPDISSAGNARAIAHNIAAALLAPAQIANHVLRLSASIGLAVYPDDGDDPMLLVERADLAMYRAKRLGRGRVVSHGDSLSADATLPRNATGSAHRARPDVPSLENLREANERLVISATEACDRELNANEARERQVTLQAAVAHELRNPLVPIRRAAEMLKRAPKDEQLISRLPDLIERQVSHMARLIDDLLDSSRVSTGKFRLDCTRIDLNEIVATAVEIARNAIDSRRQTLHLAMPAPPAAVNGDGARLTQVLSNLLDNASKYTPEGGDISLALAAREGVAAITISDNGIGIAAEMLPRVFDLFVQDTTGLVRHNNGLGIGLAVVKELVQAHGGTVSVESDGRNRGSKFNVTLPLSEGATLDPASQGFETGHSEPQRRA